jgi:hypothetical protein
MDKIKMKFLVGTKPSAETMAAIQAAYPDKVQPDAQMQFQVFELQYKGKTIYASWSGGKTTSEGPALTLVGQAAFESLINLPFGSKGSIHFIEMKLGPTPLLQKVSEVLDHVPDQGRVCLYGDLSNELDGQIAVLFEPLGFKEISH